MTIEIVVLVLVLVGAILCLTAAIGLLRFPDVPSRLHAATKPQVLGMLVISVGVALALQTWAVVAFLVPVVLIQLASAPISAHMVARQAYRNGSVSSDHVVLDELADDIDAQRDSG